MRMPIQSLGFNRQSKNQYSVPRFVASGQVTSSDMISDDEFFQLCHFFGCGAITLPDGSRDCVCLQSG